jgi:hypothetical protein
LIGRAAAAWLIEIARLHQLPGGAKRAGWTKHGAVEGRGVGVGVGAGSSKPLNFPFLINGLARIVR